MPTIDVPDPRIEKEEEKPFSDPSLDFLYGEDSTPRVVGMHPVFEDNQTMIRVYQRESGGVTYEDHRFFPYFFATREAISALSDYDRESFKFTRLQGDNHFDFLVATSEWSDHTSLLDWLYMELGYEIPEPDEDGERDIDHRKMDEVSVPGNMTSMFQMQSGITFFGEMTLDDICRMQLDIETYSSTDSFPDPERPGDEIIIVTLSDNRGREIIIAQDRDVSKQKVLEESGATKVHFEDSEEEVISRTREIIMDVDPDVIEGYNHFDFDFRYILKRCELLGVEFGIGRDGSEPYTWESSRTFAEKDIDYLMVSINGRSVIDAFFLTLDYDVFAREMQSYSLKYTAKHFGVAAGSGDEDDRTYIEGGEISDYWDEDPLPLLKYALDDVRETRSVAQILSESPFYLSQILPFPYQDAERKGTATVIEALMTREYLRQRVSVPKPDEGRVQESGGFTEIFQTGVFDRIMYSDISSLYPNIMVHWECDPGEKDPIGLFQRMLEQLLDMRLEIKHEMRDLKSTADPDDEEAQARIDLLDAKQSSYKILINCFTPDTEVMTLDGKKNVQDVEEGDLVPSLNPETGKVEIKPVTDTHEQENYKGEMVHIDHKYVDQKITPNHKVLTEEHNGHRSHGYSWKDAEDMFKNKNRHRLPGNAALDQGVYNEVFSLEEHLDLMDVDDVKVEVRDGTRMLKDTRQQSRWIPAEYDMEDWLRFLGWYISEGHLYKSERKDYGYTVRGESYTIGIGNKTERHRDDIRALLDRMGLTYHEDQNGFKISCKPIFDLLIRQCGKNSYEKRVPGWCFYIPHRQLKSLFKALYKGDGDSIYGNSGARYSTVSKQLAEDMVQLAFHCGLRARIGAVDDGCYRVFIQHNDEGDGPVVKDKDRKKIDYEGSIHCITVADNHTVLAGRNGKFGWTGQSFYGSLGFAFFAWNNIDEADRVAETGQEVLKKMIQQIESDGGEIIEVDTDGVIFTPTDMDIPRDEEAEAQYSKDLTDAMPEGIKVDHDGSFKRAISLKKKNYALLGYDQDPSDMKVKGSSLISRSNEKFGRDFVQQVLEALMEKDVEKIHEIYIRYYEKIVTSSWDVSEFAKSESLKETFEEYHENVRQFEKHGPGHGHPQYARYEVALQDQKRGDSEYAVGDQVEYYVANGPSDSVGDRAKHVRMYNDSLADEDTEYYLERLQKFADKFEAFFEGPDFRKVFSPDDGLFGFDASGIEIKRAQARPPLSESESVAVPPKPGETGRPESVNVFDEEYDLYCGRNDNGEVGHHPGDEGWLGNPVKEGEECPVCGDVHEGKGSTLGCYEEYLRGRLEKDGNFRKAFFEKIDEDTRLGCFCPPDPCHTDVIAKVWREKVETDAAE
jgi:DNA polymerase elongation subunit (family B)